MSIIITWTRSTWTLSINTTSNPSTFTSTSISRCGSTLSSRRHTWTCCRFSHTSLSSPRNNTSCLICITFCIVIITTSLWSCFTCFVSTSYSIQFTNPSWSIKSTTSSCCISTTIIKSSTSSYTIWSHRTCR